MAEHGVAIKADLGVQNQQFVAIGTFAHCQGIDLDLLGIGADERSVETGKNGLRLLGQIAGQAKCLSDAAAMMGHQARGGVDGDGVDLFGRVMCDIFDVHAAFGRCDHGNPAGGTVNEQRQIEFLLNVGAIGDVQTVDLFARFAGLHGHQRIAEHVLGMGFNLIQIERQTDTALGIRTQFLELALAASARMNLRFNDIERTRKLLGGGDGFFDRHGGNALGHRDTEFRQQFLGLIFMDIHGKNASFQVAESQALKHRQAGNGRVWRTSFSNGTCLRRYGSRHHGWSALSTPIHCNSPKLTSSDRSVPASVK